MLIARSLRPGAHRVDGERVAHCKWPLAFGSAGLQMVSAAARPEVASTIMPNAAVHRTTDRRLRFHAETSSTATA